MFVIPSALAPTAEQIQIAVSQLFGNLASYLSSDINREKVSNGAREKDERLDNGQGKSIGNGGDL